MAKLVLLWVAAGLLLMGPAWCQAASVMAGQQQEGEGGTMAAAEPPLLPPVDLPYRVVLEEDKYVMLWAPHDDHILFEVQVATRGYVGLGFSTSGGMKGADIVIGWVSDGQVFLHDRHSDSYSMPEVDGSQDVVVSGGYENATHTVLRFWRPWDTCDSAHDLQLGEDTVRVIWAYGGEDPADAGSVARHDRRGTRSLYLREPQFSPPRPAPDVNTWELRMNNVSLPADTDTVYWCRMMRMPTTERKAHVIGFVPLVESENLEHVHHIVVYECRLEVQDEHWLAESGFQCYNDNMPVSWRMCKMPFIAWGVGSLGEMFPDHVGFVVGEEHGGSNYFMLEVHYDNPGLKSGVVDSSGLALYYTETVRQYDAGVMSIGHNVAPSLVVPPGQKWRVAAVCDDLCTQQALPKEGVKVFQGLLHTHNIGSSIKLRHIREGRELPVLMQDMAYDFNFQQSRVLREERTVLPGDTFLMECEYDSSSRTETTFGGLGTSDEMCIVFLAYYPQVNLKFCLSEPVMDGMFGALGVEEVYPVEKEENEKKMKNRKKNKKSQSNDMKLSKVFHGIKVKSPQNYANKSLYDVLTDKGLWEEPGRVAGVRKALWTTSLEEICVLTNANRDFIEANNGSVMTSYPVFEPYVPEPSLCDQP